MHQSVFARFSAILLMGCASAAIAAPTTASPPSYSAALPTSVNSDLPREARPSHYSITITPDVAALRFAGNSTVDLEIFEPIKALTLHALDLDIISAKLVPAAGGAPLKLAVSIDPDKQLARFSAKAPLKAGLYRLETTYTGTINTQANGLFALDYPDTRTGKDVRALFTQFEAPDARRFAPMFDEPSYKATFDLSAIVPESQMAVSNMPAASEQNLGNGTKRVTFATSPRMSSYLLFFGLGDFERISKPAMPGVEAGIVAPAGSGEQSRYALDELAPLVPYYSDYFGQKFPLPKLDNIAGPGQSQFFGAMENWGAIFTFQRILLNDPAITSPRARQTIYEVQAHETAHQWFGDLVTMAWWDDLWLNEGFASWMATKATDHFHPEWDALLGRVGSRESAMSQDSFVTTHPIVQQIRTVEETNQAFDAITYSKGEAVIAMLEAYAGNDVWRDGLRKYMAAHKFGNAKTADLWAAIEAAGATDLMGIAKDFTTKPGVPLVRVTAASCVNDQTTVTLEQSQFSRDRKAETAASPQDWRIPLLITLVGKQPVRSVMGDKTTSVAIEGCGTVLLNAGQQGYYRSLYEPAMIAALAKTMPAMAPIDQLGLLADQFALSAGDYQPMNQPMNLLVAVPADANPAVAEAAVQRWAGIYQTLTSKPEGQSAIAAMAISAWKPRLTQLGFAPDAADSVNDANLRSTLIDALGEMGDPDVMAEAARLFGNFASDPKALDGPLKTTWLSIAATNAAVADWERLLELAKSSSSSVERSAYYRLLGAAKDDALAQRALDLAVSGNVGATDGAGIISSVAQAHGDLAVNFVLNNGETIAKLVDNSARAQFIARLGANIKDAATLERLKAYRATLSPDEQKPMDRTLAVLAERETSRPRTIAGIVDWLASR